MAEGRGNFMSSKKSAVTADNKRKNNRGALLPVSREIGSYIPYY